MRSSKRLTFGFILKHVVITHAYATPEARKVSLPDAELKITVILHLRGHALWPLCSSKVLIPAWWHQRSPLKEWMRERRAMFGKREQTRRRELEILMLTAGTAWNMRGNTGCTTGRKTWKILFKSIKVKFNHVISTSIGDSILNNHSFQKNFTKHT